MAEQGDDSLGVKWKKFEILGRPIAAFLTAVAVAGLGFFGQRVVQNHQDTQREIAADHEAEVTRRNAMREDSLLYTELMSRREESDSSLRTEMFKAIVTSFLSSEPQSRTSLLDQMLKLELLALNFGDSLSLSPLFLNLDKEITRNNAFLAPEKETLRDRLRSLARRVSSAQLSALTPQGEEIEIQVSLDKIGPHQRFEWPLGALETEEKLALEGGNATGWDRYRRQEDLATRRLDGISRSYQIEFADADDKLQSVDVILTIEDEVAGRQPTKMSFELNFFNFPMIDNTRLSDDQRFALVLEKFDVDARYIRVVGICFPGAYASLRDKPFLDDIIQKLERLEKEQASLEEHAEQAEGG